MITLQYFNSKEWVDCGNFGNEHIAWISLGGDDFNYRTVDKDGMTITDRRMK